ncbi:MAG: nitrous oxide reductase accessory protein NosL [Nitrospiraceae bacterium]|nr:nitrous oxide reductase accessory protein NosL [Nitrospiraceae bacterium]
MNKRSLSPAHISLLLLLLLSFSTVAGAADTVENPKHCSQCGMDRTVYAQSRMLITYEDGTEVGLCSIHCAALELKHSKGKQVRSIMVADHDTGKLIDARTAVWVMGGSKAGVMTKVPKWAFATQVAALKFVEDNGGKTASYGEAMAAAEGELSYSKGMQHGGHEGCNMDMGPGAQMLFNPSFGDDIYHTHPAGMWMVTYKFMHMNMSGLRNGTGNVDQGSVGFKRPTKYSYMMIPTDMTMDMHMAMLMYGITDRFTVMAMANYLDNKMNMLMDMGPMKPISQEDPMKTSGFGDTELRGIYKINDHLVGSLGISLPTGSINETTVMMRKTYRAPYDMQLGSGSYDLKPAITYNALSDNELWNWGAQAMYTWHTADNNNDWRYGDGIRINGWLQRAFGPATSWVRLVFSNTDRIRGEDPEIRKMNHPVTGMGAPTPDADPGNYGGRRLDAALGLSLQHGAFSAGIEGGVPLYQDLNGLQLKTTWFLTAGVQVMF